MAEKNKKQKPITIFSVLALVTLVIGVLVTLYLNFISVDNWVKSGERYRVGVASNVEFTTPGRHVVFYESPDVLPGDRDYISIYATGPDGSPVVAVPIPYDEAEDYAPREYFPGFDVIGRPLWALEVKSPGVHAVRVHNDHEEQNQQADRIVFGRSPQSMKTLANQTRQLTILVLALAGVLVVTFYVLHGIRLHKRAKGDGGSSLQSDPLVPFDE